MNKFAGPGILLPVNPDQSRFFGNGKHLKILQKALDEGNISLWNDFAQAQGPGFRADLRGIDLTGENLQGVKFAKARLNMAKLEGCNLTKADLLGAELTGAILKDANLTGAKVKRTVKVVKRLPELPPDADADTLRRHRLALQQAQAERLLAERAKAEAKKKAEDERKSLRDRPLFQTED